MAVLDAPFALPRGRLLGLDLGQARHGVAVSDAAGVLATPLTVIRRHRTRAEDFEAIRSLVEREQAVGVLIGLPLHGTDGVGRQARWVLRYGRRLAGSLPVPVAFWDETLSTRDASALLQPGGGTSVDAAAAALILQDFLEARRGRDSLEDTCDSS